jgi:hypothetical protein
MKSRTLLFSILLGVIIISSGCGNRSLKRDAAKVGDAMCKNIEVVNKLRAANPSDSVTVAKIQAQVQQVQSEMATVFKEFREKYGDKTKDPSFNKEFNRELRKAMLNCPYLSKADREMFEKDLEK